ncbi:MAG: thiol reductant ABC exporter subunit CydD, partial [Nocardioides sp.]|nr:thiol reductant ABC exporter subunit CydD [Nocardioides sp.]
MKPLDPRVLPHLLPARWPLTGVLVGNVVAGLLVVGQAFAGAALVATLLADPGGPGWHAPAWWFAGVTVGRAVLGWLVDVLAGRAAGRVGCHLRRRVLRSALDLEATELADRRTGELATLATRGVAAVEPYLTKYLPALVLAAVLPVVTLAAMASQDLWSALIVVLTLPLVPVFAILIGLTTQEKADREWRALSSLAGHFLDVVRGLPTLVAHRRAKAQAPTIRAVTERYRRASADTLKLAFASSAALELIATISVALVAVSVGLRLADGGMDLQTALVVLLLAPEAYWPLRRVGAEYHSAAEGTATFEAINALTPSRRALTTYAAESARTDAQDRPVGTNKHTKGSSRHELTPQPIRIDDLTLSWPGRTHPVIEHLTTRLPARGITAVVGPSGCGKSTLLQALIGELPPDDGMIRVGADQLSDDLPGGIDAWRSRVAQLPQRPWLTADSIAANLCIGRPEAGMDDLLDALRMVDLDGVVAALPHGLDTPLGEDGVGLSAGQRARLALAR